MALASGAEPAATLPCRCCACAVAAGVITETIRSGKAKASSRICDAALPEPHAGTRKRWRLFACVGSLRLVHRGGAATDCCIDLKIPRS